MIKGQQFSGEPARNRDFEAIASMHNYMATTTSAPWLSDATPENTAKGWGSRMSEGHYTQALANAMLGQDPEPMIDGDHASTTPFAQMSKKAQRHITAHMKSLGVTPESVRRRAGAHLDASIARHIAGGAPVGYPSSSVPGRDWYLEEGHALAARRTAMSNEPEYFASDVPSSGRVINAAATLSPNTVWASGGRKVNAEISLKAARLVASPETQVEVSPEHIAHLRADAAARPNSALARAMAKADAPLRLESLLGTQKAGDMPSEHLALLGSYSGHTTKDTQKARADGTTDVVPNTNFKSDAYGAGASPVGPVSFMPEAQSRHNMTNALEILRNNMSVPQALSNNARKPRTFNNNLLAPYRGRSSTVDRWETDALAPGILGNPLPRIPAGRGNDRVLTEDEANNGAYAFLEHHAAKAAAERGLYPQEGQAIRWVYRKGLREGFGQFGDGRDSDPSTKVDRSNAVSTFDREAVRKPRRQSA